MGRKYGWKLVDVEPLEGEIFEVDCVFAGKTEFPKSYYETDREKQ